MKYGLLLAVMCAVVLVLACKNGDAVHLPPGPGEHSPPPTGQPNVCQPNPDPAPSDVVEVDSPAASDSVTSPVTVSGRIVGFVAPFNITVFDAGGKHIAD